MSHPLQCRCGTLKGIVSNPRNAHRVVCYCKDCQGFAHFLGRAADVLDERGASDVIQVVPKNITFTKGIDALACLQLRPNGLLRWYASCCNTPIGNMLPNRKFSFVGLVGTCLEGGDKSLEESFGPVRAWIYTESAKGEPKPRASGFGATVRFFIVTTLKARFNGDYRHNPFFHTDTGQPVSTPRVLSDEEHARVMNAVRGASG